MSGQLLIDAVNIGFSMPVYQPQERSIMANPMSLLTDFYTSGHERHIKEVLRDISFQLRTGERIGIIGQNGAGKSTLLRLVGGIYTPTQGQLITNCNPQGLFDIALGFVPDATGLENIYLRSLEMGLSMKEIRAAVSGIVEFSGLGDSIDKPYVTYSVGMRLRLAVSIALSTQPEVMLLDEWIGAGDATYQHKVEARMKELVNGATALMLASHNDPLLKRVCTRGLVMHKGACLYDGPINDALDYYRKHIGASKPAQAPRANTTDEDPPESAVLA